MNTLRRVNSCPQLGPAQAQRGGSKGLGNREVVPLELTDILYSPFTDKSLSENSLYEGQELLDKKHTLSSALLEHAEKGHFLTAIKTAIQYFFGQGKAEITQKKADQKALKRPPTDLTKAINLLVSSTNAPNLGENIQTQKLLLKGGLTAGEQQELVTVNFNDADKALIQWVQAFENLIVKADSFEAQQQLVALAIKNVADEALTGNTQARTYLINQASLLWINAQSDDNKHIAVVKFADRCAKELNLENPDALEQLNGHIQRGAAFFTMLLQVPKEKESETYRQMEQAIRSALQENPIFQSKIKEARKDILEQIAQLRNFQQTTDSIAAEMQQAIAQISMPNKGTQAGEKHFIDALTLISVPKDIRYLLRFSQEESISRDTLTAKLSKSNVALKASIWEKIREHTQEGKVNIANVFKDYITQEMIVAERMRPAYSRKTDEEIKTLIFERWMRYVGPNGIVAQYEKIVPYLVDAGAPGRLGAEKYNRDEKEREVAELEKQLQALDALLAKEADRSVPEAVSDATLANRYHLSNRNYYEMLHATLGLESARTQSATLFHKLCEFLGEEQVAFLLITRGNSLDHYEDALDMSRSLRGQVAELQKALANLTKVAQVGSEAKPEALKPVSIGNDTLKLRQFQELPAFRESLASEQVTYDQRVYTTFGKQFDELRKALNLPNAVQAIAAVNTFSDKHGLEEAVKFLIAGGEMTDEGYKGYKDNDDGKDVIRHLKEQFKLLSTPETSEDALARIRVYVKYKQEGRKISSEDQEKYLQDRFANSNHPSRAMRAAFVKEMEAIRESEGLSPRDAGMKVGEILRKNTSDDLKGFALKIQNIHNLSLEPFQLVQALDTYLIELRNIALGNAPSQQKSSHHKGAALEHPPAGLQIGNLDKRWEGPVAAPTQEAAPRDPSPSPQEEGSDEERTELLDPVLSPEVQAILGARAAKPSVLKKVHDYMTDHQWEKKNRRSQAYIGAAFSGSSTGPQKVGDDTWKDEDTETLWNTNLLSGGMGDLVTFKDGEDLIEKVQQKMNDNESWTPRVVGLAVRKLLMPKTTLTDLPEDLRAVAEEEVIPFLGNANEDFLLKLEQHLNVLRDAALRA